MHKPPFLALIHWLISSHRMIETKPPCKLCSFVFVFCFFFHRLQLMWIEFCRWNEWKSRKDTNCTNIVPFEMSIDFELARFSIVWNHYVSVCVEVKMNVLCYQMLRSNQYLVDRICTYCRLEIFFSLKNVFFASFFMSFLQCPQYISQWYVCYRFDTLTDIVRFFS